MPPPWVLQQSPDDGTPAGRLALAFWFLWLPGVWFYQSFVMASVAPAIGGAVVLGAATGLVALFRVVVFGCVGVLLLAVLFFIAIVTVVLVRRGSNSG